MTRDIVVTHRIFDETSDLLRRVGRVHAPAHEKFAPHELRDSLRSAQAVMVFMPDRVDRTFLSVAPGLRVVAAALKGYDNIDVEACTERGVWLSIVPDILTAPTAELTVGLIIGLARHIRAADSHVRSSTFSGWRPAFYGLSLESSTVGIIGMGSIGRAVAKRLSSFGCRLLGYDDAVLDCDPVALGAEQKPLVELLRESDIVVLCAPLHDRSIHLIDAPRLGLMKRGALLVNPARGSLVNEVAVADALWSGWLGGYAADVFELEDFSRSDRPRTIPPKLLKHRNTLFGAHIGSATISARKAIEARAAQNIIDAMEGRVPRDAINLVG